MKRALAGVVLTCLLFSAVQAEEPVFFADARLKAVVEEVLWVSDPTPTDMLELTSLEAGSMEIESLVGLEYATNLRELYLRFNRITDISPLAGLMSLEHLVLHRNWLGSLLPLAGLTNLRHLDLNDTHTADIADLAGLSSTGITELILYGNQIHDLSVLTSFTSLTYLDVRQNPLGDEIYDVQIPQIMASNPGITVEHDRGPYSLTITATRGGSVINPGEGTFVYNDGKAVRIEAQADPGFVFTCFSGMLSTRENPAVFVMGWDYQIQANFESVLDTLYVDDDAADDPGLGSAEVSDPLENGTAEHPYDSIQEAIDVARRGATIIVRPGTYRENIEIPGKSIQLMGHDPNDSIENSWPVIQAARSGSFVYIAGGQTSHCMMSGFVVTGTKGQGSAIVCSGATATILRCLIAGNRPEGFEVPLVKCTDSEVSFINCTIADNHVNTCNGGIRAIASKVTMTNSIFWHNTDSCWSTVNKKILADNDSEVSISYSNVVNGWAGVGNIHEDPLFVRRGRWIDAQNPDLPRDPGDPFAIWLIGDYHLQSSAGRWDPTAKQWLSDEATSRCIDAGDPASLLGFEPVPNGGTINMGIYGGTTEASKGN